MKQFRLYHFQGGVYGPDLEAQLSERDDQLQARDNLRAVRGKDLASE